MITFPCQIEGITNGKRAVVAAQLVERSLPTPEIRGSNPVINKFYLYQLY